MSSDNIISEAYAAGLGVSINRDPAKRRRFRNACGRVFTSVGVVLVDVAFPDDPSKIWRNCRFYVVKTCAAPLIIGDSFLRHTSTLTNNKHRLKKLSFPVKTPWRVCYMDVPRRLLHCSIYGKRVLASADTGSNVDLVSLDYAMRRGWQIRKMPAGTGSVSLADGTVKEITGYVNVSLRIAGVVHLQTLYVLDGLMCDVLLGDETLDKLDVFNRYANYFVTMGCEGESDICHNIYWLKAADDRLQRILRGDVPQTTASHLRQNRFNWINGIPMSSKRNVEGEGNP
jgi:hypothetical protein